MHTGPVLDVCWSDVSFVMFLYNLEYKYHVCIHILEILFLNLNTVIDIHNVVS